MPLPISQSWEKLAGKWKQAGLPLQQPCEKLKGAVGMHIAFVYACVQIPEVVKQSNLGYWYWDAKYRIMILLKLLWTVKHLRGKWISGLRIVLWNNSMTPLTKSDLPQDLEYKTCPFRAKQIACSKSKRYCYSHSKAKIHFLRYTSKTAGLSI